MRRWLAEYFEYDRHSIRERRGARQEVWHIPDYPYDPIKPDVNPTDQNIRKTSGRHNGADGRTRWVNHMQHTDVTAARLLSNIPAFGRWNNRPLNRQLKQLLAEMDDQMLMSLTAHAVQQIASGSKPARSLPV